MNAELRKYRALAIALIATLLVSVLLFVQFLHVDLQRSRRTFDTEVERSTLRSAALIGMQLERLLGLGRAYLRLDASDAQLHAFVGTLAPHGVLESVCLHEGERSRLLPGLDGSATADHCASRFVDERVRLDGGDGDVELVSEVQIVRASAGPPSLRLVMRLGPVRRIEMTLSPRALLDTTLPAGHHVAAVCLSLHAGERLWPLVCDVPSVDGMASAASADSPDVGAAETHAPLSIRELETAGLRWQVSATLDSRTLSSDIALLPFLAFGLALAGGAVICWFAYASAARNIALEEQSARLNALLEQLRTQNHDLDQFATMAAHDLQAPLRFIVANAHVLNMDLEELDRPDLTRIGTTLIEQGERMRELVLDLLDFCRAGQDTLTISSVDVQSLLDEEIELIREQPGGGAARITTHSLPTDLCCDAKKLTQIFRNLVGNAVKFSRGSDVNRVSVRAGQNERHGMWTFRVEDSGPGIDPTHHERIFLPFARLNDDIEGTGIGLAIVRKLVERHEGKIWLDRSVSHGAAFCFTLPDSSHWKTT